MGTHLPGFFLSYFYVFQMAAVFQGNPKSVCRRITVFLLKGYSAFPAKEINAIFELISKYLIRAGWFGGICMSGPVDEKVTQAVLMTAKDGRLSCTAARKLAADLQVSPGKIGEACDLLKIKIHSCELGCFK